MQRDGISDVARRPGGMDDIAQSVVNLSKHIISNFSKASPLDGVRECSTSFEGTLGFVNHANFLQSLCGGEWRKGESPFRCHLLLEKIWPSTARDITAKPEILTIVSKNPNLSRELKRAEESSSPGGEVLSLRGLGNTVEAEEFRSFEGSRSNFGALEQQSLSDVQASSELSSDAASKEELGRATWTFLHTLAAQFPDAPTKQQKRDAKELMGILSRIYPCKECADHFKDVLKVHPVETESGEQLSQWMCRVHNVVNRSLGKTQFPCHRVDLRWGAMECDANACDLQGRLYR